MEVQSLSPVHAVRMPDLACHEQSMMLHPTISSSSLETGTGRLIGTQQGDNPSVKQSCAGIVVEEDAVTQVLDVNAVVDFSAEGRSGEQEKRKRYGDAGELHAREITELQDLSGFVGRSEKVEDVF